MAIKDWKTDRTKVKRDIYEIYNYHNKKLKKILIMYDNPANKHFDILLDTGDDEILLKYYLAREFLILSSGRILFLLLNTELSF